MRKKYKLIIYCNHIGCHNKCHKHLCYNLSLKFKVIDAGMIYNFGQIGCKIIIKCNTKEVDKLYDWCEGHNIHKFTLSLIN